MKKVTVTQFMSFDPCYDAERIRAIAGKKRYWTALDVLALEDVPEQDRLWAVLREEFIDAPILHEFACRCAEEALKLVDKPDPRSIAAIETTRKWLRGEATDKEWAAARDAARDAAWAAARAAAWDAAWAAARDAAWAAARDAARAAAEAAAWAAARDAAWAAAWAVARDAAEATEATARDAAWDAAWAAAEAAAWDAAWAAARAAQIKLLVDMLSGGKGK
jgi:hypothetical protein